MIIPGYAKSCTFSNPKRYSAQTISSRSHWLVTYRINSFFRTEVDHLGIYSSYWLYSMMSNEYD